MKKEILGETVMYGLQVFVTVELLGTLMYGGYVIYSLLL